MPFSPASVFIACRFAHFLALMLLFGQSAFIAFIAPPGLRSPLQRAGHGVLLGSAGLVAISALLMVPIEAAQMGDGWQDAARLDAWHAVLQTAFGEVWRWHLVLSVGAMMLAIKGASALRKTEEETQRQTQEQWQANWQKKWQKKWQTRWQSRWPMVLLALTSALLLASLGLVGHAAMHDGWRGVAQRLNHSAHLLSAGAWFGALLPLIHCLRRLTPISDRGANVRDVRDGSDAHDATRAVRRFSTMGHIAVGVVIATGIVNTALVLQGWPIHLQRPYEAMLDIKIVVVAVMTAIAVYNRYRWVPAFKKHPATALAALKRNTYIEIALGCAVLLLVAVFATDDPR